MNLKQYRQDHNLTLEQMAEKVGCHFTMISKLESGDRSASPDLCIEIEQATDGVVGPEDLRPDWARIFGGIKGGVRDG